MGVKLPDFEGKWNLKYLYLLTAIGFTPGGSSTVHIYTHTIRRTTQLTTFFKWFIPVVCDYNIKYQKISGG